MRFADQKVPRHSTNVLAGESGTVPIEIGSGLELETINLDVDMPVPGFQNLAAVEPFAPEIQSATIQAMPSNRFMVTLETKTGQSLLGTATPALLHFDTSSNATSAIVPLQVGGIEGTTISGVRLTGAKGTGGRVFLVGDQPLLDAQVSSNRTRSLTLYGHANRRYAIESTTNIAPSPTWTEFQQVDLLSAFSPVFGLPTNTPSVFYRARQIGEFGAPLSVHRVDQSVVIEWPADCLGCVLEESLALGPGSNWTPSVAQPQLQGGRYQVSLSATGATRFYRLRVR